MLQLRAAVALETALGRLDRPKASYYGTRARSPEPPSPEADKSPSVTSSGRRSLTATANKTSPLQRDKSEDEKVERACRSILNKLTVEKFEPLYEQLAGACGIRTPQHLGVLMREIFEKATMQHHFVSMYADLCVRLEKDRRVAPSADLEGGSSCFRGLLLSQCQTSFENLFQSQDRNSECSFEDKEAQEASAALCKHRVLGNIRLIGQLMVRGMLKGKLLVECAEELLKEQKRCAEALESCALLLTVAGSKFDIPEFRHHDRLSMVFAQVQCLSKDKDVPARIRFLLRDVLDLRGAGWPSAPGAASGSCKGPMKLDAVREQQAIEYPAPCPSPVANTSLSRCPRQSKCAGGSSDKDPRSGTASEGCREMRKCPTVAAEEKASSLAKHRRATASDAGHTTKSKPPAQSRRERARASVHDIAKSVAVQNMTAESTAEGGASLPPWRRVSVSCAVKSPQADAEVDLTYSSPSLSLRPSSQMSPAMEVAAVPAEPRPVRSGTFDYKAFRRDLSSTLRELCRDKESDSDQKIEIAIRKIQAHDVPHSHQALEFVDILVRALEETTVAARRISFQVAVRLIAATGSSAAGTFGRSESLAGIEMFFRETYEDLCADEPHIPATVSAELVPILYTVFSPVELVPLLPGADM
eukprot:gnl/TRDRNA2_/TRDRNA2_165267_c5_seq1.p1 gnl/TRDRNA2_/TRDRNA2_165267_c5~~gnl/TRDRNA2_/TRDRNA2_165267_c5_seq1.p1  ORF type:complete len:677 (-),score=132.37 gnl/TRDRNA2_/TRDRNA2_165267_c5_seq1:45-1976(-)